MATTNNRTDKILVVDDDARIRDLLRRYLTQEGFEIMIAEDGKALNRILLRETVDLIVLDLMMPGEDGLSICHRLRAATDRTPIIMPCCAAARLKKHPVHRLAITKSQPLAPSPLTWAPACCKRMVKSCH